MNKHFLWVSLGITALSACGGGSTSSGAAFQLDEGNGIIDDISIPADIVVTDQSERTQDTLTAFATLNNTETIATELPTGDATFEGTMTASIGDSGEFVDADVMLTSNLQALSLDGSLTNLVTRRDGGEDVALQGTIPIETTVLIEDGEAVFNGTMFGDVADSEGSATFAGLLDGVFLDDDTNIIAEVGGEIIDGEDRIPLSGVLVANSN